MKAERRHAAGTRPGGSGPRLGSVVLAGIIAGVAVLAPTFGGYTSYVLAVVVVQVIAVLSLNLLMGYAGQVSLGQAALVGIGAYSVHQFQAFGFAFPLDFLAAVATSVVLATIIGLPSLRIRGLQLAALTLAFGIAAERLLFARPWDQASTAGVVVDRPAPIPSDQAFLAVALGALALVLLLDAGVRASRMGRAFLAVRDREATAAAWGIPVGATKLLAYAMSGLYAGIAGGLYAYLVERLTPTPFDVWRSLGMVASVVIGGAGSVAGAAIAGGALVGLPELFRSLSRYTPLAGAVLLMLVPAVRPEGLGWLLDRRVRWPARRRPVDAEPPSEPPVAGALTTQPSRPLSLSVPVRTLLVASDVGVRFGGLTVLDSVSLEVRRGEVVGLIGPNGAGKTTFFNVISGFVTPEHGRLSYRGRPLGELGPAERSALGIARTFQHAGLCPTRTVWENVLIAQHSLARYGVVAGVLRAPGAAAVERDLARRAREALEAVGIDDLAGERVDSLPYGRQRLAEVAAAIVCTPELVLFDEPAAGMGPDEAVELGALLRTLADRLRTTMIVIEHHVPLVADLCDWVYVLDHGTVLAGGTPTDVQRDPAVIEAYLGEEARGPRPAMAHV